MAHALSNKNDQRGDSRMPTEHQHATLEHDDGKRSNRLSDTCHIG
jgi:hypothetical protein